MEAIDFHLLGSRVGSKVNVAKDIDPNSVIFKASDPVEKDQTYHLHWDMRLDKERIAGKSKLQHGYMSLRLEADNAHPQSQDDKITLWKRNSAVKDFPFSSVIAFRVSLTGQFVTHNLQVNSVGDTQRYSFTEELKRDSILYLTVQYSSGQIQVSRSKNGLIKQEIGSILLVSDYPYEEASTMADIKLQIEQTGVLPRHIQFGDNPTSFVVEFSKRLNEKQVITIATELKSTIKTLTETKRVQVISTNKEEIDEYDLEEYFSRESTGGGKLEQIKKNNSVPFSWIITFKNEKVARRMWILKTHTIVSANKHIQSVVLPFYDKLGPSFNQGDIPEYDRSPLVLGVDKDKLRFIRTRDKEKERFITAITKSLRVKLEFNTLTSSEDSDEEVDNIDHTICDEQSEITFQCLIPQSEVRQLSVWKDVCREKVMQYLDTCVFTEKMVVEAAKWEQALEFVESFLKKSEVDCNQTEIDHSLLLVGSSSNIVEKAANEIRTFINRPEEISKNIPIELESYCLLDAEGKLNTLRKQCPNIAMKVNRATNTVTFKGPDEEIENAEREILRLAASIRSISIQVDDECISVLKTEKGRQKIAGQLPRIGLGADFRLSGDRLKIVLLAQNDAEESQKQNKLVKLIAENITSHFIDVSSDTQDVLQGHSWSQYKRKLIESAAGQVFIIEEKTRLKIFGISEFVKGAKHDIECFIQKHKSNRDTISVSSDVAELLEKISNFKDKIECEKDENSDFTGEIVIFTTAAEMEALAKTLKKYVSDVNSHWFYLKRNWITKLTRELSDVHTIENNNEFLLKLEIGQSLASQGIVSVAVSTRYGAAIQIKKGDITLEMTEIIVNALSGDQNSFNAGLAKNLVLEGGKEQVREDSIPVGETRLSGPGNLRCIKIIHVVPPTWSDGNQSEDKQMKSLLVKVLKTCDDLGMTSISVPALGCGKQGFPVDKATLLIVQTVAEYISDGKSKIKEIVLCDTSNTSVENFTNAISNLTDPWFVFKHGLEIKDKDCSSIDRRSGDIGHTVTESKSQRAPKDLKMPSGPPSATLRWGRAKRQMEEVRESHEKIPEQPEINGETVHSKLSVDKSIFRNGLPFNIPISDKIHLKIERGNLAAEKVDVIVCTTPDFPNLNGEVAKAILSVGGESIIQECKKFGSIKEGEIRSSRPGNLSCNAVFHVLIPRQWNAKTGETFVYQMVINCLQQATKQRHNSIAFPVIGAGKTGFPADIVAKSMVKAACDFASQTSNSTITRVSIVVYSKADAICKIFEKTVPTLFGTSSDRNDKTTRNGRSHQHQREIEASVDSIAPYSKHSEVDDVIIVKVVSKNRGKIIQKYIEKLVEEKYTTRKISFKNLSKQYTLTNLEENKIKDLGAKFGIDVQIIQKECCVQLSGLADWVNTCELELVGLLHNEFPALRLGRKEEEGIAGAEQWYYEQDGTRNKLDMSSNFEIRKGHLLKNDFSYYNHAEQREYTVQYVMEGQMEEWPRNDPQKKRRLYISKQAESGVSYPASWTIFQNDVSEAQVVLAEHEAEFNEVKNKLIKDGCRPTQIVSIKRLENKFLWKQYQLKKAQLEKLNPQTEIEKRLWHGTKVATVDIIIKHGFNRSFAGEANMASYGQGVYFAAKSSYSDNDIYATPDATGVKRMFLNRVLTGVYCRGHQHLKTPPERPGMTADGYKVYYDSAVDDEKKPVIFVMFHDTQVFPEYLIEYKR